MRKGLLCYALVGLVLYLVLNKYSSQLRWIALGFGIIMLLFGLFSKGYNYEVDNHQMPDEGKEVAPQVPIMGNDANVSVGDGPKKAGGKESEKPRNAETLPSDEYPGRAGLENFN